MSGVLANAETFVWPPLFVGRIMFVVGSYHGDVVLFRARGIVTVPRAALEKACRENHGGELAAVYTYSGLFRCSFASSVYRKSVLG